MGSATGRSIDSSPCGRTIRRRTTTTIRSPSATISIGGRGLTRYKQLAGFFPSWNTLYSGPEGIERIDVGAVSANFLRTLGASPTIGRDFADGEDRRGAAGTVILSHEFWSRALQADPRVVGRSLTFDGKPYVVIGVMDSRFVFPESRVDVLLPLSVLGTYIDRREVHMLSVVGRLRDGVSLDAARREATPIAAQLRQEHAKEDGGLGITVRPLRDDLVGSVRRPILVLFGAVCAVLLIGCANVTNLMFGRAWSRRQELAVRTAMGAQPGAIVQQLLVESAVIALASAAGRSRTRRRRDSRAVEPAAVVDCPSRPRRSRRAGARLHADRERGGDTRVRHGAGSRCGP